MSAQSKSEATIVYGYGYEDRLAEQRRLMADPAYRRRMREELGWLRALARKRQAAGLCHVVEHDTRWSVTAPEPVDAAVSDARTNGGRAAPRRRRELRRSSSRSADSGDDTGEPAPRWPRRLAARLALRLSDAAGYHAIAHVIRRDFTRNGWSA